MRNLLIGTHNGLGLFTIEEARCVRSAYLLPGMELRCLAGHNGTIYAGTGTGVLESSDGGASWRGVGSSGPPNVTALAVSAGGTLYAGTEPSQIHRFDEKEDDWRQAEGLEDLESHPTWSFPPRPDTHHVRWILPHQYLGRLFVAIEAGALIQSPNGGKDWEDRRGGSPLDTHQLVSHAEAPERLYSAAGDGYFESADGGETWSKPEEGLTETYCWSIAVDPANPDVRVLACAPSPSAAHSEEGFTCLYRRDASGPWSRIEAGLPSGEGRTVALVRPDPEEAGVFYAVWENDLFYSVDGGQGWRRIALDWPDGFEVGEPRGFLVLG